jgi:hypothetical protein
MVVAMAINKVLAAHYEARGGPPTPTMGFDGFMMTPTPAGRYRVAYCARHSSQRRYRTWSLFRWGSEVKEEGGKVLVMHNGKWTDVATCGLDREAIAQYAWDLYRVRKIPKKWVFNDFGHMTCYLYRDVNNNARQDAKEPTMSEMLHADPVGEAAAKLGDPVRLDASHGCVHLKPADIDDMISRKFMKKDNPVIVHQYTEMRISNGKPSVGHRAPYELHFYPGLQLMCVIGVEQL